MFDNGIKASRVMCGTPLADSVGNCHLHWQIPLDFYTVYFCNGRDDWWPSVCNGQDARCPSVWNGQDGRWPSLQRAGCPLSQFATGKMPVVPVGSVGRQRARRPLSQCVQRAGFGPPAFFGIISCQKGRLLPEWFVTAFGLRQRDQAIEQDTFRVE